MTADIALDRGSDTVVEVDSDVAATDDSPTPGDTIVIDSPADDPASGDSAFDSPSDSATPDATPLDVLTDVPGEVRADAPPPDAARDPEIVAAGDIAGLLLLFGQNETAAIVDRYPTATVLTLGDNAYQSGSDLEFALWYAPSWGRFLSRTRPSPGNHDYMTSNASGYFNYFGARAGTRGEGWYSYDVGAWHLISLNSNCSDVGGCTAMSTQGRWLAADLAATSARCVLAYWHHPRFSSGMHGDSLGMQPFWQMLYDANADVVLVGHDHTYERFAPQNAAGAADSARGVREFVVGSGGAPHYSFTRTAPNSEVRNGSDWGVIRMVLHADSYNWEFVAAGGVRDLGAGACH